jgi:hypothetical protein
MTEMTSDLNQKDELLTPSVCKVHEIYGDPIKENDGIFYFNFRADRARELSQKILEIKNTKNLFFATMTQYKEDFGPFTPGFKVIPYGNAEALKKAITPNTVGFLVEPIQGEAGVLIPPDGFLTQAREICSQNRVLFILDEIQTGLGGRKHINKRNAYQDHCTCCKRAIC